MARYVKTYDAQWGTEWEEWLQGNRYELNAMSSPVFLKWLDGKIAKHSLNTKVVPPAPILATRFRTEAERALREQLIEEAIRELRVDERVRDLLGVIETPDDLTQDVTEQLAEDRASLWERPLTRLAVEAAREVLVARDTHEDSGRNDE